MPSPSALASQLVSVPVSPSSRALVGAGANTQHDQVSADGSAGPGAGFVAFDAALAAFRSARTAASLSLAGAGTGATAGPPREHTGAWTWLVRADDTATLTATLRHAARRLGTGASGPESVAGASAPVLLVEGSRAAVFAEVATMLGLGRDDAGREGAPDRSHDPVALADAIVAALGPSGALLVGPLAGAWDESVARALEAALRARPSDAAPILFVRGEVVAAGMAPAPAIVGGGVARGRVFPVGARLPAEAVASFWQGAVDAVLAASPGTEPSASASPPSSSALSMRDDGRLTLASAEAWVSLLERGVALRADAPRSVTSPLSAEETRLVARIVSVGRAMPVDSLVTLAAGCGLDRSVDRGHLVRRLVLAGVIAETTRLGDERRWIVATASFERAASSEPAATDVTDATDADADDLRAAAALLERVFPRDPFALAHAASLLVAAGDAATAEVTHFRAVTLAEGLAARGDLWARWAEGVAKLPENGQLGCRLRGAEFALVRGDVDVALEWAQRAAQLSPEFPALLVVGKASLSRGDLVGASVALTRALEAAKKVGPHAEAAANAELAEVAYNRQDYARAERSATEALASAADTSVRLRARNTLGKLVLASERFAEAEEHFASDESFAACAGDWTGEVRARLNRAIAVLSLGRLDEAEDMLRSILDEATARRDDGAATRALLNLAVMAINAQRYGDALELSERAITIGATLGERINLAWVVTNLAVLRLRLGLVEEAEQAVLFGRRMIATGDAAGRAARLSLVRARICHARGDELSAAREIATAETQSPDPETLAELIEVAVRVALADGDVARAESELAKIDASSMRPSATGLAGLAVMRAQLARARGDAALPGLVQAAITAAQRACAEEHLRDAHVLAAEVALAEGDAAAAAHHVRRAAASRDRVVETLSEAVRPRFLARPTVAAIGKLERLLRAEASLEEAAEAVLRGEVGSSGSSGSSIERPVQVPVARPSRSLAGRDPAMRALSVAIGKIARSGGTVLVQGESGTGKELVAEAIHAASDRAAAPLVKVNCAALVESLLLSELFGHEKGAFTGALGRRRGRFEQAEGGTLFLDEIGDISPATQVALLRVLQERTYERVGGSVSLHADVRVICATHRDLKAMVERGEFRKDLYFRLSGLQLSVPSLRSRIGDLPAIADALLARIADETGDAKKTLSSEALSLLARHRWPGNVRELENALRAASVFADGDALQASDFTDYIEAFRELVSPASVSQARSAAAASNDEADDRTAPSPAPGEGDDAGVSDGALPEGDARATDLLYGHLKSGQANLFDMKRQIERDCIARALAETRGNITRAATILGMKRPRLSQLVKQYGLAEVSLEGS